MKITLYTPDGTAETFTDCTLFPGLNYLQFAFEGTDQWSKRVSRTTTLPYTISDETQTLVERVNEILDKYETRGIQ